MPERVLSLSKQLADTANNKVGEIRHVTKSMKMLALNAQIEAVRAGEAGRGFTIVAQEVKSISERITGISDQLTESLTEQTEELNALGQGLVNSIRGQRLTDLALNMIEIMDRNLYERSCDVRWWATDSAVVQALSHPNRETQEYASKRLGVILGAYTVYLDLWIVNTQGQVIANGRPSLYPRALGMNVSQENWFRQAMATASGDDFSVADVQANAALDNRPVATYAAAIRENGESQGKILGVLGVFFDWKTQSETIVKGVRFDDEEKRRTRAMLLDSKNRVIAASDDMGVLTEIFPLETEGKKSGNYVDMGGRTVGFSLTPGYETYQGLGWYGVIVQQKPAT